MSNPKCDECPHYWSIHDQYGCSAHHCRCLNISAEWRFDKKNRRKVRRMPTTLNSPAIQAWASEWADVYDQKITDEELVALVGKTVDAEAEDSEGKPKGFKEKVIIGFSTDKIFFKNEDDEDAETLFALRRSVVTADGMQFAILSGMTFSESQSEDAEG